MNGQSRLGVIALIISILVILGLVIVFCFLFFLYSFYKKKQIKYGFEDKELNDEITSTLYKTNKKNLSRNKNLITYKDVIAREKSITSKLHIVMDVVSGVIIAFLLAIFITGLTYRINNDNLFIGNTTYMTILTSSMEEKNEDNDYLLTYDLNDQITQYSLIGIDKINSEDDIELYDILAYKHGDIVIVHRVVEIKENDKGETIYRLQGDSNPSSLNYEKELMFDDFIGKYNGYQNYGLGVTLTYIKSNIGIIAILGAAIFLFLATYAEEMINNEYKTRLLLLADENTLNKDLKLIIKLKESHILESKEENSSNKQKENLIKEENKDE